MSLSGRDAYRDELTKLAASDPRILCLEADLGGKNHPFQTEFPDRFFNLGITELASVDLAAGLAMTGYVPFFSTFAPFAVLRAAEGIKLYLGYLGANVKVIAPYAGTAGAWFGTTHHCLEDFAVMQAFPGIRIFAPFGEDETRRLIRWAAASTDPCYIRVGRNEAYESLPAPQDLMAAVWQQRPEDFSHESLCLVSVGEKGTALCLAVKEERPELPHVHLCALDHESLARAAEEMGGYFRRFLVVEEHRPFGGIASSLALLLPGKPVYSHHCGWSWSGQGGNHDEVLAGLGFGLNALRQQLEELWGEIS
jgi:transketolase